MRNLEKPKIQKGEEEKELREELLEGQRFIDSYESIAKNLFNQHGGLDYGTRHDWNQQKWYFSPRSKMEGDKEIKILEELGGLESKARGLVLQDEEKGKKFMGENFDKICEGYKIHLQPRREGDPQGERRPMCVAKLIKALAENPEFKESISGFKAFFRPEQVKNNTGELIPEIVIYPRLGRENFEKALAFVYKEFKGSEKYGSNAMPRHNYKINELIFIAQAGGDLKDTLKSKKVIDKYFDKKLNHAFRIGEKPPTVEGLEIKITEDFMELFKSLNQFKGIQGTGKFYKTAELKKIINQVRGGKTDISAITRSEGLREKVEELLNKEK